MSWYKEALHEAVHFETLYVICYDIFDMTGLKIPWDRIQCCFPSCYLHQAYGILQYRY